MKLNKNLILIICLLFVCGACNIAEPSPTATPIPPTATPVPPTDTQAPPTDTPEPPTATPTEAPIEFPTGEFYNGSWAITLFFYEVGTWNTKQAFGFDGGEYKVDGDQVTFIRGSTYCLDLGDGIYTWSFVDGALSFKTVEDDCQERRVLFGNKFKQQ